MIEIVALIVAGVWAVGCAVAVALIARHQSNAIAQVMAAAAESNRQFMVYSEKAINRTMAASNPMSYRSMREMSGSIEGAQAPVEGHYDGAGRKKKPAAVPAPAPLPGGDTGLNGSHDERRHIGTALDFEGNDGGR